MGLRDIGATLPPGFRFYPSDEELVCHYLYKKIANDEELLKGTLMEIDLHTCEPWQLPEVAKLNATEWYFFSFRDRKYATGFRTNRATTSGYWKATGKDRTVVDPATGEVVGMRKTLVFYRNRAPNGTKTCWIMHEFRLETPHLPPKEDWVLCRVFYKTKSIHEDDSKLSPPFLFDTTAANHASSYINSAASPPLTDRSFAAPCVYLPQQISSSTTPYQTNYHHNRSSQTSSVLNLLQLSQENSANQITEITSKFCGGEEEEYGFWWDMHLEETSLENGVGSNMEDIRFEMDNSMGFL